MFRVKSICVIIALFLFVATSTGLGEDIEVDAASRTVVIDERTGTIVVGGKATGESANESLSEDIPSKDGSNSDIDDAKNGLQVNLAKKFTLAIGFVALLGYATFYFSKKVVPKLTASKGKSITITDSVSLGQNKTLHVVEIGNKKLLIGCTSNSINTLSDLSATFQEVLQTYQEDKNDE